MSADVIQRAVDGLNRGDLDAYAAAFRPDATRGVPGVREMVPASVVLDVLRELQAAFEGLHLEPLLVLESGDHVVVRWRTTGTHTRPYQGIAPTNRGVETESCDIYEFRDGLVARSWAYADPAEVSDQLGSGAPS